jgi:hypothetical protein
VEYIKSYVGWKNLNESAGGVANRTPTKTYSEVTSGNLDLHSESFDILSASKKISRDDLFKSGNKYCKDYNSITINNLKTFISDLLAGRTVDKNVAYQKFSDGSWKIPALSEGENEMSIFNWMPIDKTFESFDIRPALSSKFGGKIAWTFSDNMWYPVIDGGTKGVLNGFGNADKRTPTHNFKPGDTVYVKMNPSSLRSVASDHKSYLDWYSGMQFITKSERNESEYSSEFSKWKDSVAIDRQRGPNTPAVPGYIVLLERENVGEVSTSDLGSDASSKGAEYIGLIV